jgi:hypothetical protein
MCGGIRYARYFLGGRVITTPASTTTNVSHLCGKCKCLTDTRLSRVLNSSSSVRRARYCAALVCASASASASTKPSRPGEAVPCRRCFPGQHTGLHCGWPHPGGWLKGFHDGKMECYVLQSELNGSWDRSSCSSCRMQRAECSVAELDLPVLAHTHTTQPLLF